MISIFGAIAGLATSVIPEALAWFKRKQEHSQEMELRRLDAELAARQAELAAQLAERQAEVDMRKADLEVDHAHMVGVYRQFENQNTSTWVDRMNALVRPVVTFCFLAMFLSVVGAAIIQSMVFGATFAASISVILPMIDAYFSAILAFWFGNRQIQKNRGRK